MNDKGEQLLALDVRFDSGAGDNLTVREYLQSLLTTLWNEGEGFSGKRPFGNSGWEYELYTPLVKAGFVKGTLDEDGYIEEVSEEACAYVNGLILAMCQPQPQYREPTVEDAWQLKSTQAFSALEMQYALKQLGFVRKVQP